MSLRLTARKGRKTDPARYGRLAEGPWGPPFMGGTTGFRCVCPGVANYRRNQQRHVL